MMYKLIDPFTQKIIQYAQFRIEDHIVTRTWINAEGVRQFESRVAICEPSEDLPLGRTVRTAEAYLSSQGYTPLRLLTCLDLEAKLKAASKSAPKLVAVRSWLDGITLLAAPDPDQQRHDWPECPWTFSEASGEALAALQSPNPET